MPRNTVSLDVATRIRLELFAPYLSLQGGITSEAIPEDAFRHVAAFLPESLSLTEEKIIEILEERYSQIPKSECWIFAKILFAAINGNAQTSILIPTTGLLFNEPEQKVQVILADEVKSLEDILCSRQFSLETDVRPGVILNKPSDRTRNVFLIYGAVLLLLGIGGIAAVCYRNHQDTPNAVGMDVLTGFLLSISLVAIGAGCFMDFKNRFFFTPYASAPTRIERLERHQALMGFCEKQGVVPDYESGENGASRRVVVSEESSSTASLLAPGDYGTMG